MRVEALSVDQVFATLAGSAREYSSERVRSQSTTTKGHRENVDLGRLDSGHHTRIGAKLELRFDSGVAKACDKAEIDLHGPVLAAIVKSQRVTNWTWCDRTLDLKKTPINAPKEH